MSSNFDNLLKDKAGHVLLLSPKTFDYHLKIQMALQGMNFHVTWASDRFSDSIIYILLLRYVPRITNWIFSKKFTEKLNLLNLGTVTHVLVIKGEGLSSLVLENIHKRIPNASFGYYLWDGIANARNAKNILDQFDSISTFDPIDAVKNGWHYRPLFGGNFVKKNSSEDFLFDWCFIGTIHSDRYKVIKKIEKNNPSFKCFIYLFFQSRLVLIVRKFFDYSLWGENAKIFFTSPLPRENMMEIINLSRAVIDIEHPNQDGFTMRTIEVLISGNKLITTNQSILRSNLYDPSRVMLIDRANPILNQQFLMEKFIPIDDSTISYYSCVEWVKELLALQESLHFTKFKL